MRMNDVACDLNLNKVEIQQINLPTAWQLLLSLPGVETTILSKLVLCLMHTLLKEKEVCHQHILWADLDEFFNASSLEEANEKKFASKCQKMPKSQKSKRLVPPKVNLMQCCISMPLHDGSFQVEISNLCMPAQKIIFFCKITYICFSSTLYTTRFEILWKCKCTKQNRVSWFREMKEVFFQFSKLEMAFFAKMILKFVVTFQVKSFAFVWWKSD